MTFPLHTVVGYPTALTDATINGQPVIDAVLNRMGIDYIAAVSTADHHFCKFVPNHETGRRFILAQLDGATLEMNERQQNAVQVLAKYGPFVHAKERRAIEANTAIEHWHDDYDAKKLQAAVDSIEARARATIKEAETDTTTKAPGLTDGQIVAGLRYLTGLDGDMASKPNDIGWRPTVSGKGHLAYRLLDNDRAAAIRIARRFIGGYTRQLRAGGII